MALLHITHPDDDHVRNSAYVWENLKPCFIERTYTEKFPDADSINDDYKHYFDGPYRTWTPETVDWGFEINETCNIPVESCESDPNLNSKVRNNSSIIRYIKQDGVGVLFGGDLEKAGWERLIADNPNFINMLKREGINILIAPHHGHKSGFPKALFDEIGEVDLVIHSKESEAEKDGTDVSSQYSTYSRGMSYVPLSDTDHKYLGKVLTTRSNGFIIIGTSPNYIVTQTASSNHQKQAK